jgi:pSer/pThr/pTyr-binding forkhead associated (FHA) protein
MSHILQVVDDGPCCEREFDLVGDRLIVGRHLNADIVLHSLTVGRRPAVLTRGENGYVVEDADSRPGTFVNGVQIKEPVFLNDGDIFHMGTVKLMYRCKVKET